VSFLAARAAPTGGFWVALAGGVALARVAERRGARQGFGASVAAMLETVAIIGPARFGVPLTQAMTAPMLGRLEARGTPLPLQFLACLVLRLIHNTVTTAFFIWVITGGLDAYAGTYDALGGRFGIEVGETGALIFTAAGLVAWGVFASAVQVAIYRRGLRSWDAIRAEVPDEGPAAASTPVAEPARPHTGRFDPRAVSLAAAVAFGLLLSGTSWQLLGAVAAWLVLAAAVARGDRSVVPTGLAFCAALAGGAFLFALVGGLGLNTAARRAVRAGLLVLVATWLRAAAGSGGLREVGRRALGKLHRLPAMPEASEALEGIASEGRLASAARSLAASLRDTPTRALPLVDAVLGWVVREASAETQPPPARPERRLRMRALDVALLVLAVAPALTLAA
jgi:hypothetical protein